MEGKGAVGRERRLVASPSPSSFGFRATTATWNALTFGGWVDIAQPRPPCSSPPPPSADANAATYRIPPLEDGRNLGVRLAALLGL